MIRHAPKVLAYVVLWSAVAIFTFQVRDLMTALDSRLAEAKAFEDRQALVVAK